MEAKRARYSVGVVPRRWAKARRRVSSTTPARRLERVRLDRAQYSLLGGVSVTAAARDSGLGSKVMRPEERQRLVANPADSLAGVSPDRPDIVERAVDNFRRADADLGDRLDAAVKRRRG